jgi:hypothetical protein
MTNRGTMRRLWPWALGVVLLAVVVWALYGVMAGNNPRVEVEQSTPETP